MNLVDVFRLASNAPEQQNAVLELARRNIKTVQDVADGVSETAALMITASAAEVVSGFAGLGAVAATGDSEKAANAVKVVQELMTYQPKTEGGQKAMQALGESIVGQFGEILTEASQKTGDFAYNKTGSEALAALAYSAPTLALEAGVLKPFTKAGKAAVKAGMHTPKMFAGAMAKTADIPKMKAAQELAERGVSRDEIWQKTGWYKGADEQWRFEIDDSGAKLKGVRDFKGEIAEAAQAGDMDLMNSLIEQRKNAPLAPFERPEGALSGDVIGHPELFEAFPDAKNIYFQQDSKLPLGDAYFDPSTDRIGMSAANAENVLSPTLHEIQHAIQEREGFAKGGSPEEFGRSVDEMVADFSKDIEPRLKELEAMPEAKLTGAEKMELVKAQIARDRLIEEITATGGGLNNTPDQQYRRLAGEAEARNVQTRMNMTPEERAATPPWKTLDVPEDELIVRGGDGVAMSMGTEIDRKIAAEQAIYDAKVKPLQEEYRRTGTTKERKAQLLKQSKNMKRKLESLNNQKWKAERDSRPKTKPPKEAKAKPAQTFKGKAYHQTNQDFNEFDFSKSADGTVWFTDNKANFSDPASSASAASGKGRLITSDIELKKVAGWEEMDKFTIDELVRGGYDGAKLDGDIQVFDKKAIRSFNKQ